MFAGQPVNDYKYTGKFPVHYHDNKVSIKSSTLVFATKVLETAKCF